ncbi:Piriformospora indica-insensitive protein 2 [Senna tora]|uniref:Piriformospora indica-insensitive protein 2 n=1 Tax=Senna tora TaxID=362788 RepID=A0A834SS79_9FABA|nr:Piriformospora indica-insensitive protein 2 [Senna tora]
MVQHKALSCNQAIWLALAFNGTLLPLSLLSFFLLDYTVCVSSLNVNFPCECVASTMNWSWIQAKQLHPGCFGQVELDVAPMEKTEQEALYYTIQGFVGNWWNGSDLYPDPCGWTPIQGVSCDLFNGFWYVTALNIGPIHENSLTCAQNLEFRQHLFEFKHLESLSFFNCFLSGDKHPITIPTGDWERLSGSLESLEFRSNPGLIGKIPADFGVLKNLGSLVLLENGLTGEIPPDIGNLIKLKRLVLAGNSLSGLIPDMFGRLSDLLILDLSRNTLSGPLPSTIGSLTSLLKLDVSNNHLDGNLLNQFAYLKNLTLMDLRNNSFSGGLVLSIEEMHSLEEMALSNNLIGGSIRSLKWEKLQNLVILELSNMGLTGEIPESISELKRLRFLGLSNNNLTGNLSPKLATLPCLSALYLSGNNLTGDLQFSEEFYGKMGRRFGAWDNPNLCYPDGEISKSHVLYGVRACQKEVKLLEINTKTKLLNNGDMNQTPHFMASLGLSSYATYYGFWCTFLVELWVIGLLLTFEMAL